MAKWGSNQGKPHKREGLDRSRYKQLRRMSEGRTNIGEHVRRWGESKRLQGKWEKGNGGKIQ